MHIYPVKLANSIESFFRLGGGSFEVVVRKKTKRSRKVVMLNDNMSGMFL